MTRCLTRRDPHLAGGKVEGLGWEFRDFIADARASRVRANSAGSRGQIGSWFGVTVNDPHCAVVELFLAVDKLHERVDLINLEGPRPVPVVDVEGVLHQPIIVVAAVIVEAADELREVQQPVVVLVHDAERIPRELRLIDVEVREELRDRDHPGVVEVNVHEEGEELVDVLLRDVQPLGNGLEGVELATVNAHVVAQTRPAAHGARAGPPPSGQRARRF
mmetsp:Transcript_14926/g.45040  ORF Transcript_14926/g.45040 Transcript_14926/m.45040 type:complete len:219 (-) Transcript_14926:128-784(-)